MTEKQLISKIRELREIKPREDWVVFNKSRILEKEEKGLTFSLFSFIKELKKGERFVWGHRYAFASLVAVMVLFGIFGFAENSVPGDFLYSLKKIGEKSQTVFVSAGEQPRWNLGLANKRLAELAKVVENNSSEKLAPAISEFQASVAEIAKSLADKTPGKEILAEIRKLEENKEKVEALGVVIGQSEELENALAQMVEREIKELENRTLNGEQEEALNSVKEDYQAGNYSQALEKILILSYPSN